MRKWKKNKEFKKIMKRQTSNTSLRNTVLSSNSFTNLLPFVRIWDSSWYERDKQIQGGESRFQLELKNPHVPNHS